MYQNIRSSREGKFAEFDQNTQGFDSLLLCLLDEIDYGVMVVNSDGRLRVANGLARQECENAGALRISDNCLTAARAHHQTALKDALVLAANGRRSLLKLGDRHVAVVPLPGNRGPHGSDDNNGHVLILLGKHQICEVISIELFARAHNLTGAERRILQEVCAGSEPARIAKEAGVALSTVRTQIASLRQKTNTTSIRGIVKMIAQLPPMRSALRGVEVIEEWR